MQLPGGVVADGALHKSFAFGLINGALELAIAENDAGPLPYRVTNVLTAALADVGGARPSWQGVHDLCVGDRQFLMAQLAAHLGVDDMWLTASCGDCQAPFDFFLRQSTLPVKPAGPGYPVVDVDTDYGRMRFRVPTGADQTAVSGLDDERKAISVLVARLAAEPSTAGIEFSERDIALVERAVEDAAPEMANAAAVHCPECGASNQVDIDPYSCLDVGRDALFEEIHRLAGGYHWSEADILAMPRQRRRRYLELLARNR